MVRFRPPTAPHAWLPRAPAHPSRADPHEVAPRVRPSNAPVSDDPGMPSHARRPGLVVGRALPLNSREEGPTPPDSSLFSRVLGVWLRAGTRCCRVEAVAVALNALSLGRKHSSCLGRCPILGVKATSSRPGHVLVSKLGRRPSALSRRLDATCDPRGHHSGRLMTPVIKAAFEKCTDRQACSKVDSLLAAPEVSAMLTSPFTNQHSSFLCFRLLPC